MTEIRNILACDTSTSTLHIALKCEEGFEERMIAGGFQHSEDLLQEITYMLERRNLKVADLDLLVCTRGPGSFTSLRIAMSTLKGFSLAKNIPLVSVPTLEAIAGAYMIPDVLTLAVLDAKKKRYYLGLYRNGMKEGENIDGNVEDILPLIEKERTLALTGPDAGKFSSQIKEHLPSLNIIMDRISIRPLGSVLIEMGIRQLEKEGPDDIGTGPVYIRRSDAEEALLAKEKNKE